MAQGHNDLTMERLLWEVMKETDLMERENIFGPTETTTKASFPMAYVIDKVTFEKEEQASNIKESIIMIKNVGLDRFIMEITLFIEETFKTTSDMVTANLLKMES